MEYQRNYRLDQANFDVGVPGVACVDGDSLDPCLDSRQDNQRWSIYLQDEIELWQQTRLTLGLRFDQPSGQDNHLSPRVGLVHHSARAGTFKLLYAEAFRDPSPYERFYMLPAFPAANPGLSPEHMESIEGIWEYRLGSSTHLTATAYAYKLKDLILPDSAGTYQNQGTLIGRGAEFELEHGWQGGTSLRASYSFQRSRMGGHRSPNVPTHMFKLNLGVPLGSGWLLGLEGQAMSNRRTDLGTTVGSRALGNLNLLYRPEQKPWELALGVYNVLDRRYADPVAADPWMEVSRDGIPQDGRTFRIQFTGHF